MGLGESMWRKMWSWLRKNVLPLVLSEAAKEIEKKKGQAKPSLSPRNKNPL